MKRLDKMPPQLANRAHPDSVPVQCDCGEIFAHEIARGTPLICPSCHRLGDVDLTPDRELRDMILAAQKM